MYLYGYPRFRPRGQKDVTLKRAGVLASLFMPTNLPLKVVERRPRTRRGAQEDFFALPIGGQGEGAAVGSRGIPFLGHVRRLGLSQ